MIPWLHRQGLNEDVKNLVALNVFGRVTRLLMDFAVAQKDGLVVSETLTQQDLANRVGTSRDVVNRILQDLAYRGYLEFDATRIIIKKPPPFKM